MQFYCTVLALIFVWSQFDCVNLQQYYDVPSSPCPQLFQYKFDGNNWIGELQLPSPPIQHNEVVLHLTLSLRAATTVRSCSADAFLIFSAQKPINFIQHKVQIPLVKSIKSMEKSSNCNTTCL